MKVFQLGLAVSLTCAASLGIVSMSWHRKADAAPAQHALRSVPQPLERVRGTVVSLDGAARTLTLQVEEDEVVLHVNDHTSVFVAGKLGALEDLALGQSVCAAWEESPTPVADWLEPCAR